MSSNDKALAQARELPLKITRELCQGKTYIVTGANVGLGLEACRHLVAIGAKKVVMAVRNMNAGEEARQSVESTTGIKGVAEVWKLDLSDFGSVREFASRATRDLDRIDAVIENAAVASGERVDGKLLVLNVNVLGTFQLAMLLLPKLRSDAKKFGYRPRLSIVTSGTGFDIGEYWKQVADDCIVKTNEDEEIGMKAYPASKLYEILAVRHLANELPVSKGGVIINVLSPGLCETTLSRNAPQQFKDQLKQMWAISGRTAECGSRTLLGGAMAGEDSHGTYMNDCEPANHLAPEWANDHAGQLAWTSIAKELEIIEPGCVERALG